MPRGRAPTAHGLCGLCREELRIQAGQAEEQAKKAVLTATLERLLKAGKITAQAADGQMLTSFMGVDIDGVLCKAVQ